MTGATAVPEHGHRPILDAYPLKATVSNLRPYARTSNVVAHSTAAPVGMLPSAKRSSLYFSGPCMCTTHAYFLVTLQHPTKFSHSSVELTPLVLPNYYVTRPQNQSVSAATAAARQINKCPRSRLISVGALDLRGPYERAECRPLRYGRGRHNFSQQEEYPEGFDSLASVKICGIFFIEFIKGERACGPSRSNWSLPSTDTRNL
ncbi:hypothetical protein EVAR_20830_1 [Eumeta japonica]|uniref:Uncharacterized protein n=1 Tax=Eumeta variegata TaxID=151549 RepID=A0A4C1UEY2_EUMVA|nr:hypothetical protein EVAR_20830_1 [Eumeta japonica]